LIILLGNGIYVEMPAIFLDGRKALLAGAGPKNLQLARKPGFREANPKP